MLVVREVRRHPVEEHSHAALMQSVDHRHQVDRAPVAGSRGEVARGLVAPRPVERVLHDRQQLDVREAVGEHMIGERVGQFVVARKPAAPGHMTPPRSEMHLVDRHRRVDGNPFAATGHPFVVAPLVAEVSDDRCRRGRHGRRRCHWVGLLDLVTVGTADAVEVTMSGSRAWHESRPHAGIAHRCELERRPLSEVTGDRDRRRVRCPEGEPGALLGWLRSEVLVQASVGPLVEEVQVDVTDGVRCRRGGHRDPAPVGARPVTSSATAESGHPTHCGRWESS